MKNTARQQQLNVNENKSITTCIFKVFIMLSKAIIEHVHHGLWREAISRNLSSNIRLLMRINMRKRLL